MSFRYFGGLSGNSSLSGKSRYRYYMGSTNFLVVKILLAIQPNSLTSMAGGGGDLPSLLTSAGHKTQMSGAAASQVGI